MTLLLLILQSSRCCRNFAIIGMSAVVRAGAATNIAVGRRLLMVDLFSFGIAAGRFVQHCRCC